MEQTILGKTKIKVGRTGFGCIPIQRISFEESTGLLRQAYENGVTLFDTANAYTTSEERIGTALSDVRDKIVIATKSMVMDIDKFKANIENSLKMLKTDYIDIFQVHNPDFVPAPGGKDGVYDALLKLKEQGKIRHIGITYHKLDLAKKAVESGLYETLQFPLSYLSNEDEIALAALCKKHDVGFLAMKGMCGGILSDARAAFAFLRQYDNVVPIWGMQKPEELQEFLRYEKEPPAYDEEMLRIIEADRKELGSEFCRGCGYCLPCPAKIPINMAARLVYFMRRMIKEDFLTEKWKTEMDKISDCTGCGHCDRHCPYGLRPQELLKAQQQEYRAIYEEYHNEKKVRV